MATWCSSPSVSFLPFLYPSLYLRNVAARATRPARTSARSASRVFVRSHLTETPAATEWSRLNPAPDDYAVSNFADKASLTLYAGHGGHGCISFHRDAYLPDGPANGGDGGHGGNIYIQAVPGETSLHKLSRRRLVRADRGKSGRGSAQSGQRGEDVILSVPVGTVIRELSREDPATDEAARAKAEARQRRKAPETAEGDTEAPATPIIEDPDRHRWVLYPNISNKEARNMEFPRLPNRERLFAQPKAPIHLDLSRPTPRPILLAAGGLGGLGNPHFVSSKTPRPLWATKGEPAMTMKIELELKLLADVGLVGLPNAGKSTLLRAVSNSRARVGSWAFTTLQPNIGTVVLDNNKGRPVLNSVRRVNRPDLRAFYGENDAEVAQRRRFTIADIPGLIEGAHLDRGLGIAFLRHVERAGVLAFVVDLNAGDAVAALKALWKEVGLYAHMRDAEERARERESRIDWGRGPAPVGDESGPMLFADYPQGPQSASDLLIAGKPWFVVATKGDLPGTEENFQRLREYLASISSGDAPHPSGVEGAWTDNCAAIPISAINGQGVDRVVHWAVGLLDA